MFWLLRPLYTLGMLYLVVMALRAVLSFFPLSPGTTSAKIFHWSFVVTEPLLAPLRKVVPALGTIDISYFIAFIGVYLVTVYVLALVVL
ncbi:MAG TPA: YggT family protein [Acidimicrobiales bacterium]|nr:YggT family protein [Acidimicrobiales bacterium]